MLDVQNNNDRNKKEEKKSGTAYDKKIQPNLTAFKLTFIICTYFFLF